MSFFPKVCPAPLSPVTLRQYLFASLVAQTVKNLLTIQAKQKEKPNLGVTLTYSQLTLFSIFSFLTPFTENTCFP